MFETRPPGDDRPVSAVAPGTPPIRTTEQLRAAWRSYECAERRMVPLRLFGRWTTPVNPETVTAWRALERALSASGYPVHRAWVYKCRNIGGRRSRSLHAYGLAIDIDHGQPTCNVNRPTPDRRAVRFSPAATKEERCRAVREGRADTSFTADQVAAVEAIRTVDGRQVFAWGGRWPTSKDTMHFQINVTPEELARGIRPDSVGKTPSRPCTGGEPDVRDYADMARELLRGRDPKVGKVLSVVRLTPSDGRPMIDTLTEPGRFRPRLKNPPRHTVLPAEVYEIAWKCHTHKYVWILSNEKSVYPVGGVLFLPPDRTGPFSLVTFNVGALDGRCTNVHHAEMQAVRWIEEQPRQWRSRLGSITIHNLSRTPGLGYGPCNPCCVDLARFLQDLRASSPARTVRASITWLTRYDRNARCGHPTDAANLARLQSAGWRCAGPGCASPSAGRPVQQEVGESAAGFTLYGSGTQGWGGFGGAR